MKSAKNLKLNEIRKNLGIKRNPQKKYTCCTYLLEASPKISQIWTRCQTSDGNVHRAYLVGRTGRHRRAMQMMIEPAGFAGPLESLLKSAVYE